MNYVGIDLGTTNSVICSYNEGGVKLWKSPEQNDVTPSVIYIDKRGRKYYGAKAENQALYDPANAGKMFKRFMGTNEIIEFESSGVRMTPEECSAEILALLYGYLPESIRTDGDTVTVITVPAAFNQMKKNAVLEAAAKAELGKVALMQEPVAAVMSVMRKREKNGRFIVYDLGGGTFDVSVAENTEGNVSLLATGGAEMCGGRDIDRSIFRNVIEPWLHENYDLPQNLGKSSKYRGLVRILQWAAENAKIDLSYSDNSSISLSEAETRTYDRQGREIYVDAELSRDAIDSVIRYIADRTIAITGKILRKVGLTSEDIDEIVFIGGPTNYKPLKELVSNGLGIREFDDINPMTAVAEGAAIFAESMDWETAEHSRKKTKQTTVEDKGVSFTYRSRTPKDTATVICHVAGDTTDNQISFTDTATGWTTGRMKLADGTRVELNLNGHGDHVFQVTVYDGYTESSGEFIEKIEITRTFASIDAIPASHSIGMEVKEEMGGSSVLEYLVREGEPLPKKGTIVVRAGKTVSSGSDESINIKLWEGETEMDIEDNRFIGVMKISGRDFDIGTIPAGAEIECMYEVTDSGLINLEAAIPCIREIFNERNFYSRQEGQLCLDFETIAAGGRQILRDVNELALYVESDELEQVREAAEDIMQIDRSSDGEVLQEAYNNLIEIKRKANYLKHANKKTFRRIELERVMDRFEITKEFADENDMLTFRKLEKTAQQAINSDYDGFENVISAMRSKIGNYMFKQDWYAIDRYRNLSESPTSFVDKELYTSLKAKGDRALEEKDMSGLRDIFFKMQDLKVTIDSSDMFDEANIVRQ